MSQRVKSIVEWVAEDGSMCVCDFLLKKQIIAVYNVFKCFAFLVCASTAPNGIMAVKIAK